MMVHAMVVDLLLDGRFQGVPPAGAGGIPHQRLIHLSVRGGLRQAFAGDPFFLGDGQGRPPYCKIVVVHVFGNFREDKDNEFPANARYLSAGGRD